MSAASAPDQDVGELLYGVRSIAEYLGVTRRQALYLVEKQAFAFWREGRVICARRGTIQAWMDGRERGAELGRRVAS